MKAKIILLILLFFLIFSRTLYPEKQNIRFEKLSCEDGLSQSNVFSIIQDRKGFMWFATEDGINKYDAYSFTVYKNNPDNINSLSDNWVNRIYEDSSGYLWIGTDSKGLDKFDTEKEIFTHYKHNPANTNSLSSNRISSICEGKKGILCIGTDAGMNKFDTEKEIFTHYKHNPANTNSLSNNNIISVYVDKIKILWVGVHSVGINKYNNRKEKFTLFKHEPTNLNSLCGNVIRSICEDNRGNYWIGTQYNGMSKFDRKKGKFTHYKHDENDPDSLISNFILYIYEDSEGLLWIGTQIGLDKFDKQKEKFTHYKNDPGNPNSLSHGSVRIIYEDKPGTLWVGVDGGGLNKFDKGKEIFTHYKHNPDNPESISSNRIITLYVDRAGIFWIGTFGGGLNRFDKEKGIFNHYKSDPSDPSSLSNNRILSINEDLSEMLWIGTYGGGFNKFDKKSGIFKHYTKKDGLPNDTVYGILFDNNGNLWLSTNKGISRFNSETETFRNYDVEDGLQDNEFNAASYYKNRKGEMFFGGVNGLNVFYPEDVKDNPHIPPIIVNAFRKLNEVTTFDAENSKTKKIELSNINNFIHFRFAALNYINPKKNQYACMLEGIDDEWIYCGTRRYASYTELKPGKYTFRVKGSNNDNVWNEEGISLRVAVVPAFWQTWWFKFLIVISGLGIVFSLYKVNIIKRQKKNLEIQVAERTKQLDKANQKLKQLATHDALTDISNRRQFIETFNIEWKRSIRNSRPISIIMIDVDDFKAYNDTYGHQAGDRCLKKIAQMLNKLINRPGDLVARYGGEEFIIILSETKSSGASHVAEKMRTMVEGFNMVHEKSRAADHVTISLGCATIIPTKENDSSMLIKAADEALYKSKESGRNCVTIANR